VPKLWLRARQTRNVSRKKFKKKRKENYFLFFYLKKFQSHRARSHTFGADGMAVGPPNV
jgi:hypothetical protein